MKYHAFVPGGTEIPKDMRPIEVFGEALNPGIALGLGIAAAGGTVAGTIEGKGLGLVNNAPTYDQASTLTGFEGMNLEGGSANSSDLITSGSPEVMHLAEGVGLGVLAVGGCIALSTFASNVGGFRNALACMTLPFRRKPRPTLTVSR